MHGMRRRAVWMALLAAMVAAAAGCRLMGGVRVGGGIIYRMGVGRKAYGQPLETCRAAVLETFQARQLPLLHNDRDDRSARIESSTPHGRNITVVLIREDDRITMVSIRVGRFGNEEFTRALFDDLDARLQRP